MTDLGSDNSNHKLKMLFSRVVAISIIFPHLLIHFNKPEPPEREHVNLNVVDDSQSPRQAE